MLSSTLMIVRLPSAEGLMGAGSGAHPASRIDRIRIVEIRVIMMVG